MAKQLILIPKAKYEYLFRTGESMTTYENHTQNVCVFWIIHVATNFGNYSEVCRSKECS
jgi:hypothetical protein